MLKDKSLDSRNSTTASPKKVSPSQFMREHRPEYYSDTEDRVSYILTAPVFEHHLETITQRNQMHDFEIFCRKLCERAICPNLRPQTGPEGGGDGKVDSETYPVSEEITVLRYVGEANGGKERWAFAFSSQGTWADKARNDVKGIVETGRKYDKIICVTSRPARSKDRLRVEKELSEQYGIPVVIHDRSWITKEIIENDREDIAFNYLKVGEAKNNPLRLGPNDYSRTQQIAEIEKEIEDPAAFEGMERQRVTEALIVAKLSRNLERPRTETDGRFFRAIRLADADGTERQRLEARYEHLWTAFWWFDDIKLLNDSYGDFENLALKSDRIKNLEFLCNLLHLLFNSVIHGHISREECQLDQRTANCKEALELISDTKDRPTYSLEAKNLLLGIRFYEVMLDEKYDELTHIWRDFSTIIDKATGLIEFNAKSLVRAVEGFGDIAGNDPAYNDLIEKTAKFVSDRTSEAEGALILLKRAQKLDLADHLDIIRFLGRATIGLAKKEYSDQLVDAVGRLMLAYKCAGLLWAARASCLFLAASLVMKEEEKSKLPAAFVPTAKTWAWIALELRHLPDALLAIQLLNGALANLPLAEDSKERIEHDILELEMALGCLILNLDESELCKLEDVPDIFEALGLFGARTALLYNLGYADILRDDGSLPLSESDEAVNRMLSSLASQPIAQQLRGSITLNAEEGLQVLKTIILGMTIEICLEGSTQSILIAEAVLGSLEAFFATTLEQQIAPHTEKFCIELIESDKVSQPTFEISAPATKALLTWPTTLSLTNHEHQGTIQRFLMEVSGSVLAETCFLKDTSVVLERLFVDEAVQNRMAMVALSANSYHRVTSSFVSRMSDWKDAVQQSYPLRNSRPILTITTLEDAQPSSDNSSDPGDEPPKVRDHRELSVRSVIDVPAWNQAEWCGTAYGWEISEPPCIAFIFENEDAARKIFERWIERFGEYDENEEIYVSIIRKLPGRNKHHYWVLITSKLPEKVDRNPAQIVMATRSHMMTPDNDTNLENFLSAYRRAGVFYLMPAVLDERGNPILLFELALLKRDLNVKIAANIGAGDIEAVALPNRYKE